MFKFKLDLNLNYIIKEYSNYTFILYNFFIMKNILILLSFLTIFSLISCSNETNINTNLIDEKVLDTVISQPDRKIDIY